MILLSLYCAAKRYTLLFRLEYLHVLNLYNLFKIKTDIFKWSHVFLIDNNVCDETYYILRVYTGVRTGSGTKSKIGFVLVGEEGDTGIRILDDETHVVSCFILIQSS